MAFKIPNPLDLVTKIGEVAGSFIRSGEEKDAFQTQVMGLVLSRDAEIEQTARREMEAKERITVAEMQQDDAFTKRARPMIVYVGLAFVSFNAIMQWIWAVFLEGPPPVVTAPSEFWVAWGGVAGLWVWGRSKEKSTHISSMAQKALER